MSVIVSTLAVAVGLAWAAPPGTFSASSEGLSFTFGMPGVAGQSGVAGGVAATHATSAPLAKAKGAGTCTDTPGTGQNLIDFINTTLCNVNNTEEAEATASGQEVNPLPNPEKCTAPIPATTAGVTIGAACGNAIAKIVGADPFAEGLGKFSGLEVDIVPLVPGKEMVAIIGRTLSTSFSEGNLVRARTDVDPGKIGFVTDPLTPNDPGSGLIVIEFSDAFAAVSWDGVTAAAAPDAKAAIVTVKFRPTHLSPFTESPLAPGQELTVGVPPVETTIKAGVKKTSVNNEPLKGTSTAEATAFDVHALKGVSGGLVLNLSRAKATVQGERFAPASPTPPRLANTGPVSWLRTAGLLALLAAALLAPTSAGKIRRIPRVEARGSGRIK